MPFCNRFLFIFTVSLIEVDTVKILDRCIKIRRIRSEAEDFVLIRFSFEQRVTLFDFLFPVLDKGIAHCGIRI